MSYVQMQTVLKVFIVVFTVGIFLLFGPGYAAAIIFGVLVGMTSGVLYKLDMEETAAFARRSPVQVGDIAQWKVPLKASELNAMLRGEWKPPEGEE